MVALGYIRFFESYVVMQDSNVPKGPARQQRPLAANRRSGFKSLMAELDDASVDGDIDLAVDPIGQRAAAREGKSPLEDDAAHKAQHTQSLQEVNKNYRTRLESVSTAGSGTSAFQGVIAQPPNHNQSQFGEQSSAHDTIIQVQPQPRKHGAISDDGSELVITSSGRLQWRMMEDDAKCSDKTDVHYQSVLSSTSNPQNSIKIIKKVKSFPAQTMKKMRFKMGRRMEWLKRQSLLKALQRRGEEKC
ncbi:hypothetical protein BP5796_07438 [Coleophoma crateriformis]|uniref:Uncharacterized protein n=1 Tax=Coleophoma crateriformis TaxID=565419 RepID=A0A3D8RJ55_9HELO|nr:hypothetical protein BP5796_07438 [Coleophoma crateriformis]